MLFMYQICIKYESDMDTPTIFDISMLPRVKQELVAWDRRYFATEQLNGEERWLPLAVSLYTFDYPCSLGA